MRKPADEVRLADFDRIGTFGASGAGKSTLAIRIAAQTGRDYVSMDPLNFLPNWIEKPVSDSEVELRELVAGDCWVTDGNFGKLRHVTGPRMQLAIWLDYSFMRVFWQLLRRTISRAWTQEELWPGCRESFRMSFFSKESILLWMIKTHKKKHRQLLKIDNAPDWSHIVVISFRKPNELDCWLKANGVN